MMVHKCANWSCSNNFEDSFTWIHSYVNENGKKIYYIYDAPSPEAIRSACNWNNLLVDRIGVVHVLDPYLYH